MGTRPEQSGSTSRDDRDGDWYGCEFDQNCVRIIKTLMANRGQTFEDLLAGSGMKRGTLYSRLRGDTSWAAWELSLIGDHFGVPFDIFKAPAEELVRTGSFLTQHDAGDPNEQLALSFPGAVIEDVPFGRPTPSDRSRHPSTRAHHGAAELRAS